MSKATRRSVGRLVVAGALVLTLGSGAHAANATSKSSAGLGCRGLSPASAVDCPSSVFAGVVSATGAIVDAQAPVSTEGCRGLSPASAVDCPSSIFLPLP
jgi:hypothetical protein